MSKLPADYSRELAEDYAGIRPSDYSGKDVKKPNDKILAKGRLPIRVQFATLPHYVGPAELRPAHVGDSGIDLVASIPEPIWLRTLGARFTVPTGLKIGLPLGYEAQVRPRSGLADKYGISIVNTPGTIDQPYTGEIKIILINLSVNKFQIEPGMRIAQLVIGPKLPYAMFEKVAELGETERGESGFGSTGF